MRRLILAAALLLPAHAMADSRCPAGERCTEMHRLRLTVQGSTAPLEVTAPILADTIAKAAAAAPASSLGTAATRNVGATAGTVADGSALATAAANATAALPTVAGRPPSVSDDSSRGYSTASLWQRAGVVWTPYSVTAGHAAWLPVYGGAGSAPLPGDAVTTPTLATACATRRVVSGYTGHAVDVQFTSGGAATAVDFLPDGSLDVATLDNSSAAAGALPRVVKCYDQSGNTNHLTAAWAVAPTILPANTCGASGDRALVFDSFIDNWPQAVVSSGTQNVLRYMTVPSGVAPATNAYSVVWLGRIYSGIRPVGWFQLSGAASVAITTNVGGLSADGKVAFSSIGYALQSIAVPANSSAEFAAISRTASTFFQYGDASGTTGGPSSGNFAGGYLGAVDYPAGQIATNGRGSYAGSQEACAFIVAGRGYSQAELAAVRASLVRVFRTEPQTKDQYWLLGDSIGQGTGSTGLQNYPRQLAPLLSAPAEMHSAAWHGSTMTQQVSYYTTFVRPFINSNARRRTLEIQGGRNDISGGSTAATVYGTLQTLMALVNADPWTTVCISTILPDYIASAPQVAQEQAYNALVRANYRTLGASCLIDRANIPAFQTNVAALLSDSLHPTTAGYGVIAMEAAQAINPALLAQ